MKKSDIYALLAASMAMGENMNYTEHINQPTDKEIKESKDIAERKVKKRKGLTEFKYSGNSVWALNRKNADRKAKLKNLL